MILADNLLFEVIIAVALWWIAQSVMNTVCRYVVDDISPGIMIHAMRWTELVFLVIFVTMLVFKKPFWQNKCHSQRASRHHVSNQSVRKQQQPVQKLSQQNQPNPSLMQQKPPCGSRTHQDHWRVQTLTIELPSELIGRINHCHPVQSQKIKNISQKWGLHFICTSDDYTKLFVSGTRDCDMYAAIEIQEVIDRIERELVTEFLQLHPMYFPVLIDPKTVKTLEDIQKRNFVKIELVQCSEDQSEGESFHDLSQRWDYSRRKTCISVMELKEYASSSATISNYYKWLVHDRGVFVELSTEVSQYLNDCYVNQKMDRAVYEYLGERYVADFKTNTLTKVGSGYSIQKQMIKQPQPVLWYHSNHTEFVPYSPSDSNTVEHMYRYGGYHTTIGKKQDIVVFDFDSKPMSVIDLITRQKAYLQRYPEPEINALPENSITLRIRGLPENVGIAKVELEQILQTATSTVEDKELLQIFSVEHRKTALAYVTNAARQYCVLFTSSMQSENESIYFQIQGTPSYVTGIHNDLISCCLTFQKFLSMATLQFHSEGLLVSAPPKQTNQNFYVENLSPDSPDWNMVLGMMQQTMPTVNIQSLQRVHHTYQWDRYQLEMRQMKRKNDDTVNEWYLFHGTRQRDPLDVVRSDRGFDFRLSREDCLLGTGVYFAVNASYSDHFHYQDAKTGLKQIILVRVLTGRSCSFGQKYDNSLRRPPELPSGSGPGLYDTVNGYTNGSFVYVVYDHSKSYPAFIITYK